MIIIEVRNR